MLFSHATGTVPGPNGRAGVVPAPTRRHYRLIQRIATGGMAEVFLANVVGPAGFERKVVIKRILARWAHNEDVLSLFRDEARLGSILDHPNSVQVLDYGRHGDGTFLVLEYVEGRNLAELIGVAAEEGRYEDERTHRVCVEDFSIGKYEVTFEEIRPIRERCRPALTVR